jgi:hypothetical protein
VGKGRIRTENTIYIVVPAGSYTSQPDLIGGYRVSDKTGYFSYNYFVTREDGKAVFSIPGNTLVNWLVPSLSSLLIKSRLVNLWLGAKELLRLTLKINRENKSF